LSKLPELLKDLAKIAKKSQVNLCGHTT